MTPLRCAALTALSLLPVATIAVAQSTAAPLSHVAERTPTLTVDPPAVRPGDTLTLTGRGFPRNAQLTLLAGKPGEQGKQIGSAHTGRRGTFTATIRIRANSSAAALVARACFDACRVKAGARFRIVTP